MRAIGWVLLAALAILFIPLCVAHTAKSQETGDILWVRQFGTVGGDYASAVAVDVSGVYVAGRTLGALPADDFDAFLRKYDANGILLWDRQIGTASFDYGNAVGVDESAVYVAGHTGGNLEGGESTGSVDAYLRKYDSSSNVLWTRQFGSSDFDTALAVALDASGTYVAGRTEGTLPGETSAGSVDAFLRKYDPTGNVSWTRQFGTSAADWADGLAVDSSGAYVAGLTGGTFPGEASSGGDGGDAFLRKYDPTGNVSWTRQFGTSAVDWAYSVALDASGLYVAGLTVGTLAGETSSGGGDGFLRKYDLIGNVLWTRQFGSSSGDAAFAVTIGGSGVYVVGQTDADSFVRKYDASGELLGLERVATAGFDSAKAVAVSEAGLYVAGETTGAFPGETNAGGVDAFLAAPREPLPAPVEGSPEGTRLLVGLVASGAILIALVAGILLVRWWILRPRH